MVNNAGYLKMNRPLIKVSNKEAQDMWNLNFMAAFALAREALPHIRKVKGNILFISSVGG